MASNEMLTQRTDVSNRQSNWFDATPFPGKKIYDFPKNAEVALLIHDGKLKWFKFCATHVLTPPPRLTWLVVVRNGYMGFFNESTGTYLGYSNDMIMPVKKFDSNAYFLIRNVESGGFALQAKARKDSIKEVLITTHGARLELADHEGSSFVFSIVQRQS